MNYPPESTPRREDLDGVNIKVRPEAAPGRDTGDDASGPTPPLDRPNLAPLPRRERIERQEGKVSTVSMPPKRVYHPPAWLVLARLVVWLTRVAQFFAGNFLNALRRRNQPETQARRLREMLESMGPTAIKIGQQLSVRADILPYQYCDELTRMQDKVPPFELAAAIRTVENAISAPLEQVFETFDPAPIGSASLACVYQAKLHTGELVAVKVKRPGIGMRMAAELKAISALCQAAEVTGIIRSDVTANLRLELSRMLTEELDFCLEARYTEIFRRDSRNHPYVSAPRVYHEFSDYDVLVTELITGVFLNELLEAIEREDRKDLNQLLQRGFRPRKIARRMNQIFHWETFEGRFFHADPHPANIIVKPDNTLVMIDFGSCGAVSSRIKRKLLSFNRFMVQDDLHGMVQNTISMLEPLPHFDVDSFSIEMMNIFREVFLAHQSKSAPWYDKCSGTMWMKVIALSHKYNLPMTLDTIRIFRATFMYDSIIYRLHPGLDAQKDFCRWAKGYDRKNRRRTMRAIQARLGGPLDSDFTREIEMRDVMDNALDRFQRFLDQPSYNFGFTIGKVSYVFTIFLKSAILTAGFLLVASVSRMLHGYIFQAKAGSDADLLEAFAWTINNKIFILGFTVYAVIAIRKILFKLQDVEVERSRT